MLAALFRKNGTPKLAPSVVGTELDSGLIQEIRAVGFHPFIIVRVGDQQPGRRDFRTCRTQNEAPQFVNELGALPGFNESLLLRGIERALQLEIYDAADLVFN